MNRSKKYLLIMLLFPIGTFWAQTSGRSRLFGEMETKYQEPIIEELTVKSMDQYTPIEGPIDPDSYILGPGDILGVNIITSENLTFLLPVNPTGELLIPTVGIVKVAELTLTEVIIVIKEFIIQNAYRNAEVDVTLVGMRKFRILVMGGVVEPGFVTATLVDRLTDVISEAGGLHKYADEERIRIVRWNGNIESVSIKQFLLGADLDHNLTVQEGDRIEVPFLSGYQPRVEEFTTYNKSAIFVIGFVRFPGALRYFPGYSVQDYIGMAGGVLETGDSKKVLVSRLGLGSDIGLADYARPGDTIYVPENIRSRILGNASIIQTLSAIAGLYLSYLAATR